MLEKGGSWAGAARSRMQTMFRNGETVTWQSQDVLEPHATVQNIEEIARKAAEAEIWERFIPLMKITKKLLAAYIDESDERIYVKEELVEEVNKVILNVSRDLEDYI